MKFKALPIAGSFLVTPEPHLDSRGSFARIWDAAEFAEHGLASSFSQVSVSASTREGTLRGLHYQAPPSAEVKLVTCVRGRIWDVVVDLRPSSSSYRQWHAEELDASGWASLYVPEGVAHGYLTLTGDAWVLYEITTPYDPASVRGIRWDDQAFAIEWPGTPSVISSRDEEWEPWTDAT